jgi:hypothetical protein
MQWVVNVMDGSKMEGRSQELGHAFDGAHLIVLFIVVKLIFLPIS